jgi:hypothetical protein
VNDQHVLRFERLFISRACFPSANKRLLVAMNVVGIYVAYELILSEKLETATSPMTISFEENTSIILSVGCVGENSFAARAAVVVAAGS